MTCFEQIFRSKMHKKLLFRSCCVRLTLPPHEILWPSLDSHLCVRLDFLSDGLRQGEIWAYGIRNPWRMSFDRETGELWVGDVGQDLWEEVDLITRGGNYGWSAREGFHPLNQKKGAPNHGVRGFPMIDPIIEYGHCAMLQWESRFPNHSTGVCIIGGYVYRGTKIPALRGVYVYGDYQVGTIWGLRYENRKVTADDILVPGNALRTIPSFAEDGDGERVRDFV